MPFCAVTAAFVIANRDALTQAVCSFCGDKMQRGRAKHQPSSVGNGHSSGTGV